VAVGQHDPEVEIVVGREMTGIDVAGIVSERRQECRATARRVGECIRLDREQRGRVALGRAKGIDASGEGLDLGVALRGDRATLGRARDLSRVA